MVLRIFLPIFFARINCHVGCHRRFFNCVFDDFFLRRLFIRFEICLSRLDCQARSNHTLCPDDEDWERRVSFQSVYRTKVYPSSQVQPSHCSLLQPIHDRQTHPRIIKCFDKDELALAGSTVERTFVERAQTVEHALCLHRLGRSTEVEWVYLNLLESVRVRGGRRCGWTEFAGEGAGLDEEWMRRARSESEDIISQRVVLSPTL